MDAVRSEHASHHGLDGDATAAIPERFARTAVRAGRVSLALPVLLPMRQAHYLLRPLDDPTPSPRARAFLAWLSALDRHQPPLADERGAPDECRPGGITH